MKQWPQGAVAIICGRHDDPHRKEVPDSLETDCWQCGYTVVISRKTVSRALTMNHKIICVQCAAAYAERSGQKMRVIG